MGRVGARVCVGKCCLCHQRVEFKGGIEPNQSGGLKMARYVINKPHPDGLRGDRGGVEGFANVRNAASCRNF